MMRLQVHRLQTFLSDLVAALHVQGGHNVRHGVTDIEQNVLLLAQIQRNVTSNDGETRAEFDVRFRTVDQRQARLLR